MQLSYNYQILDQIIHLLEMKSDCQELSREWVVKMTNLFAVWQVSHRIIIFSLKSQETRAKNVQNFEQFLLSHIFKYNNTYVFQRDEFEFNIVCIWLTFSLNIQKKNKHKMFMSMSLSLNINKHFDIGNCAGHINYFIFDHQ